MKALLAQLGCRIGDVAGNTARAVAAIQSHPDADIAIFPELYLSGYTYRDLDQVARERVYLMLLEAPPTERIAA